VLTAAEKMSTLSLCYFIEKHWADSAFIWTRILCRNHRWRPKS